VGTIACRETVADDSRVPCMGVAWWPYILGQELCHTNIYPT